MSQEEVISQLTSGAKLTYWHGDKRCFILFKGNANELPESMFQTIQRKGYIRKGDSDSKQYDVYRLNKAF